jgi:hypothetical protein
MGKDEEADTAVREEEREATALLLCCNKTQEVWE